tara:strand:- start:1848 stop:2243 length:396 start_codon:yes stop_codon:yes gene_type:complete
MNESIDFQYGSIVVENGIMKCSFYDLHELTLEITRHLVAKRIEHSNGISYPCLFDISRIKHSTKEARDYLANEGNELVTASAILVDSAVLKMAANFYVSVNKPVKPTRLFTDKQTALDWLHQFIESPATSS